MARRNQAEEINRAVDRFAGAVRELTAIMNSFLEYQKAMETRFLEYQRQFGLQYEKESSVWGAGEDRVRVGLSEEEAIEIARGEVSEVRRLSDPRRPERLPPPDDEEIEEWERRREERWRKGQK